MADNTLISWADATWNPITGCSLVSPGCTHCYAMGLAGGRLRDHPSRAGLTVPSKAGPVWNGQVRFNEEWLDQPLRWRRPRRIFVCAHGDLFHPAVPLEWIKSIWEVMHHAHRQRGHIFQILTKRPEWIARALGPDGIGWYAVEGPVPCPEPGIWLGTSIENQEWADIRVPFLLNAPAAVRFVSCEPLISHIDLTDVTAATATGPEQWDCLDRVDAADAEPGSPGTVIDWVIVGGESGPGARPMHPAWARSLREQFLAAGVAFHFKQWGEWAPYSAVGGAGWYTASRFDERGTLKGKWLGKVHAPTSTGVDFLFDGAAFETSEIKGDLLLKFGKKRAGRALDGRTWDEYPA